MSFMDDEFDMPLKDDFEYDEDDFQFVDDDGVNYDYYSDNAIFEDSTPEDLGE